MFSATFSSVKHATFVYIANELSNLLTYFLSHPGTVSHIRVHIPKLKHGVSMTVSCEKYIYWTASKATESITFWPVIKDCACVVG